jgi:hypothetical protein
MLLTAADFMKNQLKEGRLSLEISVGDFLAFQVSLCAALNNIQLNNTTKYTEYN